MDEERIRDIIREEISSLFAVERYTFQKHLQIFDGRNIQTGRSVGTKIATSTDQLIGFYGVTPVNQPDTLADPSLSTVDTSGGNLTTNSTINTNFTNLKTAVNTIIDRLQELGLMA